MANADDLRAELRAQIDRAARQGMEHVEINSGQLHRVIGDYPGVDHRMPICCSVMEAEMREATKL